MSKLKKLKCCPDTSMVTEVYLLTQYLGVTYSYVEVSEKKSPFHLGKNYETFLNEVVRVGEFISGPQMGCASKWG